MKRYKPWDLNPKFTYPYFRNFQNSSIINLSDAN